MWHRNVSTCFIPAYYVLTLSPNVTIGEIIDYILMRAISSWWTYNYIIKHRTCTYLGATLPNLLKLFFFGRGFWGDEHIYQLFYCIQLKKLFQCTCFEKETAYWVYSYVETVWVRLFFVLAPLRGDFMLTLFCSCILQIVSTSLVRLWRQGRWWLEL